MRSKLSDSVPLLSQLIRLSSYQTGQAKFDLLLRRLHQHQFNSGLVGHSVAPRFPGRNLHRKPTLRLARFSGCRSVWAALRFGMPLGFAIGVTVCPAAERKFIHARLVDFRHPGPAGKPHATPLFGVPKFAVRIGTTPGDKSGEDCAASILTDRVKPKIETPANLIANV